MPASIRKISPIPNIIAAIISTFPLFLAAIHFIPFPLEFIIFFTLVLGANIYGGYFFWKSPSHSTLRHIGAILAFHVVFWAVLFIIVGEFAAELWTILVIAAGTSFSWETVKILSRKAAYVLSAITLCVGVLGIFLGFKSNYCWSKFHEVERMQKQYPRMAIPSFDRYACEENMDLKKVLIEIYL